MPPPKLTFTATKATEGGASSIFMTNLDSYAPLNSDYSLKADSHVSHLTANTFHVGIKAADYSGGLFYGDDGTGAHAAVQIAVIRANLPVTAANFWVV